MGCTPTSWGAGGRPRSSNSRRHSAVSAQCELLGVSYSSLYYRPVELSALDLALKCRSDEIYTAFSFHGSRRMIVALAQ